jgi:tRNA uridine 5-carboxymethylaminomethyl modification enzyme
MAVSTVIVVGGGHAGVEAAWAAASALAAKSTNAARVLLVTMNASTIGAMSCNPAIGGLAKGQMVREIDALGGVMGRATDATGILFRVLNASKGQAVRGPRAQCDRHHYQAEVQRLLSTRATDSVPIIVVEGLVESAEVEDGVVRALVLRGGASALRVDEAALDWNSDAVDRMWQGERGECVFPRMPFGPGAERRPLQEALQGGVTCASDSLRIAADAVVLTTGTFMRALMHTGEKSVEGGRVGEGSAVGISGALRALGFELGRLKTGTPPRLARASVDWQSMVAQWGDEPPLPFSAVTPQMLCAQRFPALPQVECRETHTTASIHEVVRGNLHRAPMYAGLMEAESGPRYCPSLEDKVVRFAERESHHVFLEPESLATDDIYCNGISTSLPAEVQAQIVHGIPGCERAQVKRWGYAVEYDMVWPHQIDSTGETKRVQRLFLAGQINGTSGYEEAAAQGLVAGLNAARRVCGLDQVRVERSQAYLGVLMDDLVTRQPREPYRMFTSRAEHRLLLRADNAEDRLTAVGVEWGLVCDARRRSTESRAAALADVRKRLSAAVAPQRFGQGKRLAEVARRPEVTADLLVTLLAEVERAPAAPLALMDRAITDLRYECYLPRQRTELRRASAGEHLPIPPELDVRVVAGLSAEAREVLGRFSPRTLGQAGRLAGMSPADVSILEIAIRRLRRAV